MTLERENQLISELQRIEAKKRELIRQIVEASLAGKEVQAKLSQVSTLSKRKGDLTRPSMSLSAA
jgi:hypothetical protein